MLGRVIGLVVALMSLVSCARGPLAAGHSSAVWSSLRQCEHLTDVLALPVKSVLNSELSITAQLRSLCLAARRRYALSYTTQPNPSNFFWQRMMVAMYAIR